MPKSILSDLGIAKDRRLDPRQLAEQLAIPMAELARMVSVSRNSLADQDSPKVQTALAPIATILAAATKLSGDIAKSVIWFKFDPIPSCGYKTPMQLVAEQKSHLVLGHIENIRNGVYA
jgi:uncharacterized protein (DUF2384 family)